MEKQIYSNCGCPMDSHYRPDHTVLTAMEQPENRCLNCGEPVNGLFCSNCGQETRTGPLTWRSVSESILSSIIGNGATGIKRHNARYGILYTIWQLFKCPGTLIGEYISGQRLKYYDPVNLLLLLSTIYILIASLLDVTLFDMKQIEDEADTIISAFFGFIQSHPWVKALLQVPFIALTLKWFFRKRSTYRHLDYIYVAIFFSIVYIMASVLFLPLKAYYPQTLWPISNYIRSIFILVIFTRASCTIFRTGWLRALLYNICIQIISLALILLTIIIILLIITILHDLIYSSNILLVGDSDDILQVVDSLKP